MKKDKVLSTEKRLIKNIGKPVFEGGKPKKSFKSGFGQVEYEKPRIL